MIAAQRAMAEGDYELAAQRLIYARDAEPRQRRRAAADDARLLAGRQARGGRPAPCATGRASTAPARPPHRFASRIYEDMGAVDLAEEAAERAVQRGPSDAGAWERLGRLRLRLMDREGALEALRRATALGAGEDVRELIVQALALEPRMAEAQLRRRGAPCVARGC